MSKGNIISAIKHFSNNMENGILPLNDTTLNLLKQKHPCQSEADKHFLFNNIPQPIHKISMNASLKLFEILLCVKEMVQDLQVSIPKVGGEYSHPTYSFCQSSTDICMALANVAKKLCVESY